MNNVSICRLVFLQRCTPCSFFLLKSCASSDFLLHSHKQSGPWPVFCNFIKSLNFFLKLLHYLYWGLLVESCGLLRDSAAWPWALRLSTRTFTIVQLISLGLLHTWFLAAISCGHLDPEPPQTGTYAPKNRLCSSDAEPTGQRQGGRQESQQAQPFTGLEETPSRLQLLSPFICFFY